MPARKHLTLVPLLTRDFPRWVEHFALHGPFTKPEQLSRHRESIELRRSHADVAGALDDVGFLKAVYETLKAWGIGSRASHLKPFDGFAAALRAAGPRLCRVEARAIDDPHLHVDDTIRELWTIIDGLGIVDNAAPLVAGTKAVHHILPDLLPPMDRAYTQRFFGWHNPQFQFGQEKCFRLAFAALASVAREVQPRQFVGQHPWHTSASKVLDNALVGLVRAVEDGQAEA